MKDEPSYTFLQQGQHHSHFQPLFFSQTSYLHLQQSSLERLCQYVVILGYSNPHTNLDPPSNHCIMLWNGSTSLRQPCLRTIQLETSPSLHILRLIAHLMLPKIDIPLSEECAIAMYPARASPYSITPPSRLLISNILSTNYYVNVASVLLSTLPLPALHFYCNSL